MLLDEKKLNELKKYSTGHKPVDHREFTVWVHQAASYGAAHQGRVKRADD